MRSSVGNHPHVSLKLDQCLVSFSWLFLAESLPTMWKQCHLSGSTDDHTLHIDTKFILFFLLHAVLHLFNCVHRGKISTATAHTPPHPDRSRARGTSPCVSYLHTCVLMVSVCYCFHRTVDGSKGTWLTAAWRDKEDKAPSTEPGEGGGQTTKTRVKCWRWKRAVFTAVHPVWLSTDRIKTPNVTICINCSSGFHTFVVLLFLNIRRWDDSKECSLWRLLLRWSICSIWRYSKVDRPLSFFFFSFISLCEMLNVCWS